jgi:hypothetical protein
MTETVDSLRSTISQIQNSVVRAAAQDLLYYAGITGEFAGRSPSNADAPPRRPVCKPIDYDTLRRAKDQSSLDALRRHCTFVEERIDERYIHSVVYLPSGYCEPLKAAFEGVVRALEAPPETGSRKFVVEYKGARFETTKRQLARRAQLRAMCQTDGALRVRAPRMPH